MNTIQFYLVFHIPAPFALSSGPFAWCSSLPYMYESPSIQLEQPEYSKNTVNDNLNKLE